MTTEAEFRTSVLPFTLQEEGGFQANPKDPGNWTGGKVGAGELRGTKYGIAAASHPHLDIANLTLAQASGTYWQEYCRAPGFDRLALPLLQVVFDAGVMSGPARATTWLTDSRTKATVKDQIAAVSAARLAFCKSRKTWSTFGDGWGKRIAACEKRALLLAAAAPVALPVRSATAAKPVVTKPAAAKPAALKPAASKAPLPKPATQPKAGVLGQFLRVIVDALFSPIPKGAHT